MKLYEKLAGEISSQIRAGVLRPGDRIPSLRTATRSHRVSVGTVMQAYSLLEDRGEIHTRPRSGYYVSVHWQGLPREPEISRPSKAPSAVDVSELVFEVLEAVTSPRIVNLGSPFPSPQLFPLAKLAQSLHAGARRLDPQTMVANPSIGNIELRRQIARRYLESGMTVATEELVITNGALEGLMLCLQATTRPGDLVAIESPAFYAILEALERLGLKAVEVSTHPRDGMDLAALDAVLRKHPVKTCWIMTNFQNPLGSLMPENRKRELVRMLAERNIPLIEDDVYLELYFDPERPQPAKAFDRKGLVLHCSSFSKCLAPGYRIGWTAPGRYVKEVERIKLMTTITTSLPIQAGIVEYLKHGGYNAHLRKLRGALAEQRDQMMRSIRAHFPAEVRVSRPQGGYFLWVEMPETVDALQVHRLAMEKCISIAPGPMFSPRRKFENCIRLNYGAPWSPRMDAAIATLGGIILSLSASPRAKQARAIPAA